MLIHLSPLVLGCHLRLCLLSLSLCLDFAPAWLLAKSSSLFTNGNKTYSQNRKGHPTSDATSNSGTLSVGIGVGVDSCMTHPGDGTCVTSGNSSGLSHSTTSSVGCIDGINGGGPHADTTNVAGAMDDVYYGTDNGA